MNNEDRISNEQCTMNNVQWKKVKLGEVGEIITGSTPPTTKTEYWDGEYNFYSPVDFNDSVYCNKTERTVTKEGLRIGRIIPANSIMVACIASIGKIAVNKTVGITNQQINTIIPNDNNDCLFLYYLLLHNALSIKNSAAQTTIPIINKEDFSNLYFNIPPSLSVQRRIAAILSSADKVIASTQKVIDKLKQIKQGMMETLLNEQCIMNNVQWKKVKLGECCERICNGLTYDVEETQGHLVTRIETISDGVIDYNKCGHIKETPNQDYLMIKGDILFSHINSVKHIGKVAYYKDNIELYHGMNLLLLRANCKVDKLFLYYLLTSDNCRKCFRAMAKSAVNQASISTTDLGNMLITFPTDLAEQRKIARFLQGIDKKIETETNLLNKYKEVKKGLMEKLLNE